MHSAPRPTTPPLARDSGASSRPPLESLIGQIGAVVWEFDREMGCFASVGEAAEQLLGFSPEEWKRPGFLRERLHDDEADSAAARLFSNSPDLANTDFECRLVHRHGSTVWVRCLVDADGALGDATTFGGLFVDISAHRATELRLAALERRLSRLTAEKTGRITMRLDAAGTIQYANGSAMRLLGGGEPLEGENFFGLVRSAKFESHVAAFREHLGANEDVSTFEFPVVVGGLERLLCWHFAVSRNADGATTGISVVGEDITDRTRFEADVARRAEGFDAAFELSQDAFFRLSAQGTVLEFSASAQDSPYPAPEEMLGKHLSAGLAPDAAAAFERGLKECHGSRQIVIDEYSRATPDGVDHAWEARFLPLEHGDTAVIVRDITRRKAAERLLGQSEQRFRAIVEQSPFGMHLYRLDAGELVLTGANRAADMILRIDHEGLLGRTVDQTLPGLPDPQITNAYSRIAEVGGAWQDEEIGYEASGTAVALEIMAFQILGGQVAVLFRDVTERHDANLREQRYLERLSALAADLTDAEDAERRRLAEELHDRVSQALAVAMMRLRAAERGDGTYDAAEVEESRVLLASAICETRTITTELFPPVLHELGLAAAARWLCDETERNHGLPCVVEADSSVDRLGDEARRVAFRAIRELLMNVVKHARAGHATVTLAATAEGVEIVVADDGCGFDAEAATADRSFGFGLFSIRDRLPHLGGELEIVSAPIQGTRILVRIPWSAGIGPLARL